MAYPKKNKNSEIYKNALNVLRAFKLKLNYFKTKLSFNTESATILSILK